MNSNTEAALKAAHSPAARKKAMKTLLHLAKLRGQLAKKYNITASYFSKGNLLETCKRLNIPLHEIHEDLFHPFPPSLRGELLAQRKQSRNGGGSSIPLDAIPERKKHQANGEKAPYGSRGFGKKGHPNAHLIEKTLDRIADPKTTQRVADRLLVVLEKLMA